MLSAASIAREIRAKALIIQAEALMEPSGSPDVLAAIDLPVVLIARSKPAGPQTANERHTWISIPAVQMTRTGLVKVAVLVSLAKGLLRSGDRVVCVTGVDGSGRLDTIIVLDLGSDPEFFSTFEAVDLPEDLRVEAFQRVLEVATHLGVEGREGRAAGALFVIGDVAAVEGMSRPLILNPFHGYPETARNILDPAFEDTLKAYSSLDGAVLVRGDGTVVTAGVQLVPSRSAPPLPHGLGTRHAAAAAITACSDAVAITVSETTGTVSVFKGGRMITDIHRPSASPSLVT